MRIRRSSWLAVSIILVLSVTSLSIGQKRHQNSLYTIKHEYDSLEDRTVLMLFEMPLPVDYVTGIIQDAVTTDHLQITLTSSERGRSPKAPRVVLVSFDARSDISDSSPPTLVVLAGKERLTFKSEFTWDPKSEYDRRHLMITLPFYAIVKIANSQLPINGNLGDIRFHFDKDNLFALREFVILSKQPAPPTRN
jgi:hypothetical protein